MKIRFSKFSRVLHAIKAAPSALFLLLGSLGMPQSASAANVYTPLFNFTGAAGNFPGNNTTGSVITSGNVLYGTADMGGSGGPGGTGVLFSYDTSTNIYKVLHNFTGSMTDGDTPLGTLLLVGTTLYGTTEFGGQHGLGTIYSIDINGSGFQLLHSFAGGTMDGSEPLEGLTLSGTTLFGTTVQGGGMTNRGTIYSIDINGTGYQLRHSFVDSTDGSAPRSLLILVGNTLYGTTPNGGPMGGLGTIFKINTNGTGFSLLHTFTGGATDGISPFAGLTVSGNTLYGTTHQGGSSNFGVIYQINTSGSGFSVLHSFSGPDGKFPESGLTFLGDTLYGTTTEGGANSDGVLFSFNPSTGAYSDLVDFSGTGGASPGSTSFSTLALSGNTLYGTTQNGGATDLGVVFSFGPQAQGGFRRDKERKAPKASLHPHRAPTRTPKNKKK